MKEKNTHMLTFPVEVAYSHFLSAFLLLLRHDHHPLHVLLRRLQRVHACDDLLHCHRRHRLGGSLVPVLDPGCARVRAHGHRSIVVPLQHCLGEAAVEAAEAVEPPWTTEAGDGLHAHGCR